MTLLIKVENHTPVGNPILQENFLALFPETSFPGLLTSEVTEDFGYGVYDFASQPELGRHEKAVEVTPVKDPDTGIYRQTWEIQEMDAAEKAEADEKKAEHVRAERNYKLSLCDWTQLADSPLPQDQKDEWALYRQELRNLPSQPGFPWDITWPEEPKA